MADGDIYLPQLTNDILTTGASPTALLSVTAASGTHQHVLWQVMAVAPAAIDLTYCVWTFTTMHVQGTSGTYLTFTESGYSTVKAGGAGGATISITSADGSHYVVATGVASRNIRWAARAQVLYLVEATSY